MKKLAFAFFALFFSVLSYAQIEGKWKTIDDETGKPKSIVEIFKKSDGKYYGKIVQLLQKPENNNSWFRNHQRFKERRFRIY